MQLFYNVLHLLLFVHLIVSVAQQNLTLTTFNPEFSIINDFHIEDSCAILDLLEFSIAVRSLKLSIAVRMSCYAF